MTCHVSRDYVTISPSIHLTNHLPEGIIIIITAVAAEAAKSENAHERRGQVFWEKDLPLRIYGARVVTRSKFWQTWAKI